MTAQTTVIPALAAVAPPAPPPPPTRLWGHVARRCVLAPIVVLAPLLAVAPSRDHRFNVYWHGGMFRGDPGAIVSHTIASGDVYLRLGNFRPLGRMLEKSLDLLAFTGTQQLGLPVNVTLRAVSIGAAVLLTLAVVLFAESVLTRGRLFGGTPSRVALLLPYAVAAGFVAAGQDSTTILFGGLYLTTAALVLTVAATACRLDRLRWWNGVLAVTAGAALAVFNEPAYFAVPLATAAVLIRGRFVLGLTGRELLTSAGVRFAGLLWAGFLPAFATVRWIIRGFCAQGGCYQGSDLIVDGRSVLLLPVRMVAWLPPLQWRAATAATPGDWLRGVVPVVALLLLGALAARTLTLLPKSSVPAARPLLGLAALGVVVLACGALLATLSVAVRSAMSGRELWEQGWRDSALTVPGGMLLVVALVLLAGRRMTMSALAALVLLGAVSATANRAYADTVSVQRAAQLDNRIAAAMGSFDRSRAGDARRCALLDEAIATNQGKPFLQRRYRDSLDVAARSLAGVPFCEREAG
ncbi:hypothetical protein FHR83_000760 [Actinoplanes campanulatus]|uniref:4-amino-4-deoxy-L-arabinose transferase n=1 Tax=Actinoplanes campanulatus TaxID=113559 RepID=A0A7W5ABG4_9ACTN|nr:hypothetical protein [Actinoplanes campanulatus]MBB3093126.1 hypothetical protein [Actinoplanes campanulatus]GGN01342.1 hypothetical protein GCM10010109_06880 [Actinoplanes campanulatus]GID33778.1 hypothetical protein Aca09nite_02840 [Actinoplanes campanulatus]